MSSFDSSGGGVHFNEPWQFMPYTAPVASLEALDSGNTPQDSSTTAFFTEMARRGAQDTTNWTADTYKTILNVSSGKGFVAAYIGCTAGGAQNHTVEFTVDGQLTEIEIPDLSTGERAMLIAGGPFAGPSYTTEAAWFRSGALALDANKQVFGGLQNSTECLVPTWVNFHLMATPLLKFNTSLLIRAKHSANITNSTATAYSAVMYRLGL